MPNMVGIHKDVLISFILLQKMKSNVMNQKYQMLLFLTRETSNGEN